MIYRVLALLVFHCAVSAAGQSPPTEYWAVRPWEYWAATPTHMKMCAQNGQCYSTQSHFIDRHILQFQANGSYGVLVVLPEGGVGIVRDYGGGVLRCFSDIPGSCELSGIPPGYSPEHAILPVLDEPGVNTATTDAQIYYALNVEHVNFVDTQDCSVWWIGSVVHSGSHFMLHSYDFGPPVGVLSHIYVTEEAQGCPTTSTEPMHCQRIERYFFAPGLGRIRQEGWNDPDCDGVTPSSCRGVYSAAAPGAAPWTPNPGPPVAAVTELCP